ncbi:hypothetical protein BDY21DRAFT_283308 [Lineolata rhizophorae]|uniref:DUF221-domain-containing protein n=1 Tax=Lineolata rhizophorae TaxID=578093 RepID=A0A6A6P4W7_9PEZI|nr:hypothetical protein BDY21DRAFT_283308 [Lineolata rhizophorae]
MTSRPFRISLRQLSPFSQDQDNDENIGSAQNDDTNTNSASSLLSTLAPVALIAFIWLLLFLFFRVKFPRQYSPRTFLGSLRESERSPQLPSGLTNWFAAFFRIPDTHILNHHTLDGYLFLRLLKMGVVTCLVGCAITWPVLFPVNITGGGGQRQLDILTIGNVSNSYWRYFAHAGCAYLFFGFVIFMITRESIFYINLRQAYLMSPIYANRMSSRTVLYTSVPGAYLDQAKLREMLGSHVKRVWIPTDTSDLEDVVGERDKVALKLEGAETKLIKLVNKARGKALKNSARNEEEQAGMADDDTESGSVAARWIAPKKRPTHRLKPIIGKKVDTINWCRAELQDLIPRAAKEQEKHVALDAKKINAVFVEFDSCAEAQAAFQSLTHHQVLHMAPRYTGIVPEEIIWQNLRIKWWERIIRIVATTAFIVALIIFWSIPVAFVASISNIDKLIEWLPWLEFINDIPDVILGVVTGLLPVVLLAVLMSLLPIVMRFMARLSGDPSLSAVELTVQHYYFGFQVVQVFLVATLGSAASSAVGTVLDDPSSAANLLSSSIPKASNFYLAYFILQGLGVVSGLLVGLVGLILFKVLGWLLDSTPRKMYQRWTRLSGMGWGTVYPVFTNLFVIAICYSCIAPLVLAFAAIGLYFFYFAYRYNLLFVYDAHIDTKGLAYPRALQHLFIGLYLAEICLIGLFALQLSDKAALGPFILMIILLIFTALYQVSLNVALTPLLKYLPRSLEAEERGLLEMESGVNASEGDASFDEATKTGEASAGGTRSLPPPHKKPGVIKKFLRPDVYNDYPTMRRMVPRELFKITYEPAVEANAYFHPSIRSKVPLLWIPRDPAGVSRQEVRDTSKVCPITDEGATIDEKGKIHWNPDERAPIYEDKVYF